MLFHRWNPFYARELLPSGRFFRKCMRIYLLFQIRMRHYLINLLNDNGLDFRKWDAFLNNFDDLRNSHFYGFCKSLKMNTLNQRPKSCLALFFANIWIKIVKRNICENFDSAVKQVFFIKCFILSVIPYYIFSQKFF